VYGHINAIACTITKSGNGGVMTYVIVGCLIPNLVKSKIMPIDSCCFSDKHIVWIICERYMYQ